MIGEDGVVIVTEALDDEARRLLGLAEPLRVRRIAEGHSAYLPWHWKRVFKRGGQHG